VAEVVVVVVVRQQVSLQGQIILAVMVELVLVLDQVQFHKFPPIF
jgi:hypothetical protein